MKYWIATLMRTPAPVLAGQTVPAGHRLSGLGVTERTPTATDRALDQQRRSARAERSEISVPVYVDTQKRLAESFRTPIPETFGNQTRDEE